MVLRVLDRLEEWLIAVLMAAATLIIFAAVVHRYASGFPIIQDFTLQINMAWAQELCIFMFIWMAKFGAAYGVRTGIHVGVDIVVNAVSEQWRRGLIIFSMLSGALFTAIVGIFGATFCFKLSQTEQVSADLEWPMWIIYLCIPLGSFLMCFRFLQVLYVYVKTGHLPRADHSFVEGLERGKDPDLAALETDEDLRMGGKA
jgi:C4-dicarboxylate transporter DctQ subunit